MKRPSPNPNHPTTVPTFYTHLQSTTTLGHNLPWFAVGWIALAAALLAWAPRHRRRVAVSLLLSALAAAFLLVAAALLSDGLPATAPVYRWTHFLGLLLLVVAAINVAGVLLFGLFLPAVRLRPPAIVSDILVAFAYIAALIALLGHVGVNLTGIVATSAVVTAVIAFSLQDTLGNIMGGMAVQLDRSIHVGDWIKLGDTEGRVVQIRWRHTAVETRNWDTVLIPNSLLTKSSVTVLGRRQGEPLQHRQWVYFNVDFRHSPTQVIDAVDAALRHESIPLVAAEPPAHCILMDFKDSYGAYAVRYWLTDLAPNDLVNSQVRALIYAALKRADIPLSIPAQSVFVTEDDAHRRDRKESEETDRRLRALAGLDIFATLTDDERRALAARLKNAPFVRGETIVRQGTRGDWLGVLARGRAEVRVASDDGRSSQPLATLNPGDFFGEMGLMTGGERTASVVALTDVACYRLDKHDVEDILARRPQIAADIARTLTRRKSELDTARHGVNEQSLRHRHNNGESDLLNRIRRFFTLEN